MTRESYPFLRWFASHPTAANLLMLIFLFMGLVTASNLKRETFPEFESKFVEIVVVYPGASTEEVEDALCRRIEDALDGVPDVYEVKSEAREGRGRVVAEMEDKGNLDRFITDIRTEVDAIDDFPEMAEDPVVKLLNRTDMVLSIAVAGPMSVPDLKFYCEEMKDRLMRLPEISQVDVLGFSDHQLRIEIPAGVLMRHGLSVSDIADRISRQSIDLPAGSIETRDADVLIRFMDERRSIPEYEDLIIFSSASGAEIRLGDIARITDTFELDEDKIIFNGQRAGMLQVSKAKRDDTLKVVDAVTVFLDRERELAPPTVSLTVTRNISEIVRDRLNLLTSNGFQGLVLVFLTMWLFFSFRFSFWVAMGLPVSFLGAIFAMQAFDLSLNMITMVGLLLAIGLLMDDAIVISENVSAHLARGKSVLDAAVDGTAEVARGVLSSFTTTVCIFGSIALMIAGDIGKVLWVMPVVLILTLLVSLVEAFCILPNHLAHSLKGKDLNNLPPFRKRFNAKLEEIRENLLGRAVDWVISWRYLFVGGVFALLLVSVGMIAGGYLKVRAFPDLDGDVVEARILLPQGTPLARTEAIAAHVGAALDRVNTAFKPRQPGGQDLVENINIQYNTNQDSNEAGPHIVTVSADLLSAETRNATIDDMTVLWRKEVGEIPDTVNITYKQPQIGPGGLDIDIRLTGSDLARLKAASLELQGWLNNYAGMLDLNDDLRPGKPEIRLRLKEGALALGLDAQSVASQLRSAFHGRDAAEVQVGSEKYEINVRMDVRDQDSLADLDYFHVTTPDGEQVPLEAVASVEQGRGVARIARVNSIRTVTIQGDVDGKIANSNEILSETKRDFLPGLLERYPDVEFILEGQAKEGAETGASLRKAFLIGIFGVFVLLSFQFKSYVEPIVVLAAIPLALIGVIWGHLLMGLELSMPSIMGFVSLAGVVVNDSILLVEFVKFHIRKGEPVPVAAAKASRQRFRAVLLTSLTTIMGLIPLLLERSLQAQVLIPLVTSLVFGLLASTMLVLLVIPALFSILADLGLTAKLAEEPKI